MLKPILSLAALALLALPLSAQARIFNDSKGPWTLRRAANLWNIEERLEPSPWDDVIIPPGGSAQDWGGFEKPGMVFFRLEDQSGAGHLLICLNNEKPRHAHLLKRFDKEKPDYLRLGSCIEPGKEDAREILRDEDAEREDKHSGPSLVIIKEAYPPSGAIDRPGPSRKRGAAAAGLGAAAGGGAPGHRDRMVVKFGKGDETAAFSLGDAFILEASAVAEESGRAWESAMTSHRALRSIWEAMPAGLPKDKAELAMHRAGVSHLECQRDHLLDQMSSLRHKDRALEVHAGGAARGRDRREKALAKAQEGFNAAGKNLDRARHEVRLMASLIGAVSHRVQAETTMTAVRQLAGEERQEKPGGQLKVYELIQTAQAELGTGNVWCAEALRVMPEFADAWADWNARLDGEMDKLTPLEQSLALASKVPRGPRTPHKSRVAPAKPAMGKSKRELRTRKGKPGVRFEAPAAAAAAATAAD